MVQLLPLLALAGIAAAQQSLNDVLASNDTSALLNLLQSAPGVIEELDNAQNLTILAPSNSALQTFVNSSAGAALDGNVGLTTAILQYHVLNGTYYASAVTNTSAFLPTYLVNGTYSNVTGGQVVNAVRAGENVTFFSGLNANVSVVRADLNFTGGTVHIIDGVLTVPENASSTAVSANLTALAGALIEADLVEAVDGLTDVTIFAPNNEAFQRIGSVLSDASDDVLTQLLEYHVVNGTVGYSSDLSNNTELTTLGGESITVRIDNGTVFVNGAQVVTPDVLVANGVVHVIDNVLNPSNTTAAPTPSATAGAPGFSGASSQSSIPFTSEVPSQTTTVAEGPAATSDASDTSTGAAPMKTAAMGAAALFGAGAAFVNL